MSAPTITVAFCRSRLPLPLARQLMALKRNLRGRTIGFVVLAHVQGLDLQKLVDSAAELRRLGVLLNLSLRVSRGNSVDEKALRDAVRMVKGMFP